MNKCVLSEYATYVTKKIKSESITSHNYISTDNMLKNKGGVVDSEYTPEDGNVTEFKRGDILLSNIRPYLKKIWLATFDGGCSSDVLVIRSNGKVCSEFLYSILAHDDFFAYDMKGSSGSKMPRGDKNHIMAYPIDKTLLDNSEKIGKIISLINKKIACNENMNNVLDNILNDTYIKWFYLFDFPNKDNVSYKENGGKFNWSEEFKVNYPEEWKISNMYDTSIYKIIKSGVDSFQYQKNYLATANVNNYSIVDGDWITFKNRESRANMQPINNSVWFAKMKNSIKHITITATDKWFINKYILSTGFCGLECKSNSLGFVHCLIGSKYFEKRKDLISHGATQEGINNEDLKYFPLIVPTENILDKFQIKVEPLLRLKMNNIEEMHHLIELRDYLIPLLISKKLNFK